MAERAKTRVRNDVPVRAQEGPREGRRGGKGKGTKRKGIDIASAALPSTTKATHEEARQLQDILEVVDIKGKGMGVRAKRKLEPGTFVGVLPGFIYSKEEHEGLVQQGLLSDKYAIEGEGMPKGKQKKGHEFVVNSQIPGSDKLHPEFRASVGHFMNEPSKRQRQVPVSWVHNYAYHEDVPRLELYTNTTVPKGRELTIHYGKMYDRSALGYRKPLPKPPKAHSILPSGAWERPDLPWDGYTMSAESDTTLDSPTSSGGLKAGSRLLASTQKNIRADSSATSRLRPTRS